MNEKDLNKNIVLVGSLCIAYHLYKYLRYRYCYGHIRNKAKHCCLPNCHSPLITSTILYNIYLGNEIHLFHFFIVSYAYTQSILSLNKSNLTSFNQSKSFNHPFLKAALYAPLRPFLKSFLVLYLFDSSFVES